MGLRERLARLGSGADDPIHIGDPRFDDWEVVRDFADLKAAEVWLST